MSKPTYLIANWKMQLGNTEAATLAKQLSKINLSSNIKLILCPSYTALSQVRESIKSNQIGLGAQNVFYHEKGAYTGEISPIQIKELGVNYVIIGHSERRQFMQESDNDINQKTKICLENNITPIICIGETFDERKNNLTTVTIIRQLTKALEDVKLNNDQNLIIAYEPVWVIGSGQAIAPESALEVSRVIKKILLDFFSQETINQRISIIYGGSVDNSNIKKFLVPELLEGALIGGASLTVEKFSPIINSFN